MNFMNRMNKNHCTATDYGALPYVTNLPQATAQNTNFRTAIWTGTHLQMTLMCIPPCGEIGLEIHPDTDQAIRIEQGNAVVKMGQYKDRLNFQQRLGKNDTIFVPAGTWHNIINTSCVPLKISSIYAPPHHSRGTIHCTKQDAEKADY